MDRWNVSVRALSAWQTSFFETGLSQTQREFRACHDLQPPPVPLSIQPEIAAKLCNLKFYLMVHAVYGAAPNGNCTADTSHRKYPAAAPCDNRQAVDTPVL
jgi:hypothetical protein